MLLNETNIVFDESRGQFKCPYPDCSKSYHSLNGLRTHAKYKHQIKIKYRAKVTTTNTTTMRRKRITTKVKDPKLIREKGKARTAKCRKNAILKRANECATRVCFTKEDAKQRGLYHDCHLYYPADILSCNKSTLGKATGNGVFAREDLKKGDYITIVHGREVNKNQFNFQSLKKTHLFQLQASTGTLLLGIDVPERGKGLGSFIQRGGDDVIDATSYKRKCKVNCMFVVDREDHHIYIKVMTSIKQDRELFMTYGQGVTV
jgi:hypothetical protein